jgi:flagellar hook protein FlgE
MSFRTALSGLNSASADLGVISNNIANSSSTGFKSSRTEFADIYAASNIGTASNAIGSGVRLASVAQQFAQGNVAFTNNALDLAINGQGFFRLSDNGTIVYSRAGAFSVDRSGYIVNGANQRLTAFQADTLGNITGAIGDLKLTTSDIAPKTTTTVNVGLNLNAAAAIPTAAFSPSDATSYNNSTSLTIYDSLGTSHLATMYYRKTAANTWATYLYVDGTLVDGPDTLGFSTSGALATINTVAVPPTTITSPSFTPSGGGAAMTLTLDYAASTQFGSNFSVNSLTQNGYTTGRLSGVDIDTSGVVFARYTNGQSRALGQVALANFSNPQGLRQLGNTAWAESFESGAALIGAPGSASLGVLQSGALEGSNVDLTEQLVNMITAQRNFQANAQVISALDTVTQAIINIR